MKSYITYNKLTGEILRTGCCPSSMLHLQANSTDEGVVEGTANDVNHKIVNKVPVKLEVKIDSTDY